jgi:hypothetical protein
MESWPFGKSCDSSIRVQAISVPSVSGECSEGSCAAMLELVEITPCTDVDCAGGEQSLEPFDSAGGHVGFAFPHSHFGPAQSEQLPRDERRASCKGPQCKRALVVTCLRER